MTGRRAGTVGALAVIAVVLVALLAGGGGSREVTASFVGATNLVSGAKVTAGGAQVGTVQGIRFRHGLAEVRLGIADDAVWPLREGTTAVIRFGGTVSYSNRYVELRPGPRTAPRLRNGARLATTDTVSPVEFDDLFNVFDSGGRAGIRDLVDRSAATFGDRAPALRRGLQAGAPALETFADLLDALGDDPQAVRTLLASGAATTAALEERRSDLIGLIGDAGTTFATIGDEARVTGATLARLPRTLRAVRHTLGRLPASLDDLDRLTSELRPGARGLRRLATPLARALRTLRTVAPDLDATLAATHRAAPRITALLDEARPVLRRAEPVLRRSTPMAGCLRAYAPEIAGFVGTWKSMGAFRDANGHFGRVQAQFFPFPNEVSASPGDFVPTVANLGYAFVRPPGYINGTSWLLPECGAGQDGIDPAKDPEPR